MHLTIDTLPEDVEVSPLQQGARYRVIDRLPELGRELSTLAPLTKVYTFPNVAELWEWLTDRLGREDAK